MSDARGDWGAGTERRELSNSDCQDEIGVDPIRADLDLGRVNPVRPYPLQSDLALIRSAPWQFCISVFG